MWFDKPYIPWCLVWHWNIPIYGSYLKYWCLVFTCTFMFNWMFQYSILHDAVSILSYAVLYSVGCYIYAVSRATLGLCAVIFQAFSTPWFLYANPTNHHLVFFLLEVFNNVIQYQFDGLTLHARCLIYFVSTVVAFTVYWHWRADIEDTTSGVLCHIGYDVRSPVTLEDMMSGVLCHPVLYRIRRQESCVIRGYDIRSPVS